MGNKKKWDDSFKAINNRNLNEQDNPKYSLEEMPQEETPTNNQKKKKVFILGAVLGGFLFVAIVILLIILFYSKTSHNQSSNFSDGTTPISSSVQASSSDNITLALTEWNNLSTKEQIVLLIQSYAELNPQTTILSADKIAMNGSINKGVIEWYDSDKFIHKVNVKIDNNKITYDYINGATWEKEQKIDNLEGVIANYYQTQSSKENSRKLALKVITSKEFENINSDINLDQISQGNYSSAQGTWKSLDEGTIVFENNECYYFSKDNKKTKMILENIQGEDFSQEGFLKLNSHAENSPAGAGFSFLPIGYEWAGTDKTKARIWWSNTFGPEASASMPERQITGIQRAIYYRVSSN
ncbi:DUF6287 domain-containing protein [Lactococcus garvieae]|uniref:DUF6287 domain-containing protein n=1 Tax=Lactococcus garvieae TaxID=1363 RepID=UPI00214B345D|nr:DUF6287 domain-containing protein [Lactococcus garvieae]